MGNLQHISQSDALQSKRKRDLVANGHEEREALDVDRCVVVGLSAEEGEEREIGGGDGSGGRGGSGRGWGSSGRSSLGGEEALVCKSGEDAGGGGDDGGAEEGSGQSRRAEYSSEEHFECV